jgi:hypothetical protein
MPTLTEGVSVKVADECWIALALLHQEHSERGSFSAAEIRDRLEKEEAHPDRRPGIQAHIYQHNVANVAPSSARYRMFYRLENRTYRLYKPGDVAHRDRKGKTKPAIEDLPERYHGLLKWYETHYSLIPSRGSESPEQDPILRARGLGKEIWIETEADAFVADLRAGWSDDDSQREPATRSKSRNGRERRTEVWKRVLAHAGEEFKTKTGLPFTYQVDGDAGIWFYRDGRRINKRLWRGDFDKAVERCPLRKVTDISDCFDPAYLFALLSDKRIRGNDW